MRKYLLFCSIVTLFSILLISCKKDNSIVKPNTLAEFPYASGSYSITSTASSFKIPVGFSDVQNVDRTITFKVTSSTGAVLGTQYNLVQNGSITIPAGQATDSIEVQGLFSGYGAGQKDVLLFTITGGDVPTFLGFSTYQLTMQKFCPLVMSDFAGSFKVVTDQWNDYPAGTNVTLTVSGNTIFFDYPTDYMHKTIPIVVNPTTLATSVAKIDFGGYGGEPVYSCASVAGVNSLVVPCDGTVSVLLNFTQGADNYGNGVLKLKKN